jgi:hypothetical protein
MLLFNGNFEHYKVPSLLLCLLCKKYLPSEWRGRVGCGLLNAGNRRQIQHTLIFNKMGNNKTGRIQILTGLLCPRISVEKNVKESMHCTYLPF